MANIVILESAQERFNKCAEMSRGMDNSLEKCIERLRSWNPADATISIGTDHDELSFRFFERYADGRRGIDGGIIFHGRRDGYGSGCGPTFSVTPDRTEGYTIHT